MYSFSGPAEVRGTYQKIRDILQPLLIIFFLVAPWISINNQPMILFDIFNRHFVFFGFTFFSHDAPLLFFLLILIILAIFIVTALFGRLWCGWSCPQTVFIHALFNKVEKLILGNYTQRHAFYNSADSFAKKIKIIFIYTVFMILSWILAHSFVAYFLGAQVVTQYIIDGPVKHWEPFLILSSMTTVLFLNFTFFREKLCFIVCPYGRFQNALIDTNSLVVFYDTLRGEPRGKMTAFSAQTAEKGDCIDCHRCVNVCPTKIDIRQGFQLECIACGKCVDACNEVMHKVKRQPYLIRYETGNQKKITLKRFRLLLYVLLFVVFSGGLAWTLSHRSLIDFRMTRSQANPFSVRYDGSNKIIVNQIHLHVKNQTETPIKMTLTLSEKNSSDGYRLSTPAFELELQSHQDVKIPAFLEIDEKLFSMQNNKIDLILKANGTVLQKTIPFIRIQ